MIPIAKNTAIHKFFEQLFESVPFHKGSVAILKEIGITYCSPLILSSYWE